MTAPAFNQPFDPLYDLYSVATRDFEIPDHFDVYAPDQQVDFACLSVIAPSQARGATEWTLNRRWISIGIYRDEGRAPAQRPPATGLTWSRVGKELIITDPNAPALATGDLVNLYGMNVPTQPNASVWKLYSPTQFSVQTMLYGPTSGAQGSYQLTNPTNFYEDQLVFRLLPSFKLIPYSLVLSLFAASAPSPQATVRQLYSVTSAGFTTVPGGRTASTAYQLPYAAAPTVTYSPLQRRFNQQYDETGAPLPLAYQDDGQPLPVNELDSPTKNEQAYLNQPITNVIGAWVPVYDFYGFSLNDPSRGPYFASNIISRDQTVPAPRGNIARRSINQVPIYGGLIFDIFGNRVIGIQENNQPFVRDQVLPLSLDSFNRPVKAPQARQA